MNIIEFKPLFENVSFIEPKPAVECFPKWYKDASSTENGEKFKLFGKQNTNLTYKKCAPYQDALSMGYILFLQEDILIDQSGNSEYQIVWNSNNITIAEHKSFQVKEMVFDSSHYSPFSYKWLNRFYIKTKPGYSCLFTHPLNRLDLPFLTLSGVVDTDKHSVEINFPFFLKNTVNGVIPRGTPIVQVIPFKRQNWKMKMLPIYKEWISEQDRYNSYLYNAYRKIAWARKSYR